MDTHKLMTLDCGHPQTDCWLYLTQHFEHPFRQLVGAAHHVRSACEALGQRWVQNWIVDTHKLIHKLIDIVLSNS